MEIRLADENDLDALMAIVRGVVPLMRAEGNLQWGDDYPNQTIFLQDIDLSRLWVAVIDAKVAGSIALTTDAEPDYEQANWDNTLPAVVIHRLAVDPAQRGAGVAKALMLHAEEVALAKGISLIRTDTNSENKATQRLFPSMGYRFAGEISLRARPGLRFLCYEKLLSRP
ncbi:GNAT family N-acetyltransferase [Edaphobacter sp. HDX4]|uniref:GNAT family N-acetyltransferase n=1 Tax=Edaphobacter sp. HDX4 TaxID=2794064 RepID=UPI002FE643EC